LSFLMMNLSPSLLATGMYWYWPHSGVTDEADTCGTMSDDAVMTAHPAPTATLNLRFFRNADPPGC
jgi:hypothetical protein